MTVTAAPTGITVRVGDTRPYVTARILDDDTGPIVLTDSTVVAVLSDTTGAVVWTHPAHPDADQTANPGLVTYAWAPAETAHPGEYVMAFRVTYSDGSSQTFPPTGGIPITVTDGSETPAKPLLITPDSVARRLGIPRPLDPDVEDDLAQYILEAMSDVEAYLGRDIVPTQYVEKLNPLEPLVGYSGDTISARPIQTWDVSRDPVISIDSVADDIDPVTGDSTGFAVVTYTAGYDARVDPRFTNAIRYVRQATITAYRVDHVEARTVRSSTVEGQSVQLDPPFDQTRQVRGVRPQTHAGGLPSLESLSRFRRRNLFSRPRASVGLNTYGTGGTSYDGMAGVYQLSGNGVGWDGGAGDARGYY